jgi:hypothetical protein
VIFALPLSITASLVQSQSALLEGHPMSDESKRRTEADAELEKEIRQGRKFSPSEAMARMAGPGAMKGASPVSHVRQAEIEIGSWLKSYLADGPGALQVLLHRHVKGTRLLLDQLDRPLCALKMFCQEVLESDFRLRELVREADAEWAQRADERPYFETEGSPPHPDDPYTIESVRKSLAQIVEQLDAETR